MDWQEILERHAPLARGLARQALRRGGLDPSLAEDVLQEVWTELLSRSLEAPERYILAAVLNRVRNRLKESGRRAKREQDHAPRPRSPEVPEEPLIRAEASEALERALGRLEPMERLLLRWIYWDSMSYGEAAKLMGLEPNSVGPALSRARERLRLALDG